MAGIENFFQYNGTPEDGFIMDVEEEFYRNVLNDDASFPNLGEVSKYGHYYTIKEKYDIDYDDILAFDDDVRYFSSEGLGEADVYVAGVLRSEKIKDQGIRFSLFREALAYYVFDRIEYL